MIIFLWVISYGARVENVNCLLGIKTQEKNIPGL